jgi:hypothetical protein
MICRGIHGNPKRNMRRMNSNLLQEWNDSALASVYRAPFSFVI